MKNSFIFAVVAALVVSALGSSIYDREMNEDQSTSSDKTNFGKQPPPYLVAINEKVPGGGVTLRCSGTLLSPNKVLVDSACADYLDLLEVVAGIKDISALSEESRQVRSVETALNHPFTKFFHYDDRYEVATIFEVEPPFQINKYVQPVGILGPGNQTSSYCEYSGWGRTSPANTLQFFQRHFDFIGEDKCRKALKGVRQGGVNVTLPKCYPPLNPETDELSELIKPRGGPMICDGYLAAQGRMQGVDFNADIPEAYYPIMFEIIPLTWWLETLGIGIGGDIENQI